MSSSTYRSGISKRQDKYGSSSSHLAELVVPTLSLGSNMLVQRRYEHLGSMLVKPIESLVEDFTSSHDQEYIDINKAQSPGHTSMLTARLVVSAIQHVLFVKGQITEPLAQIRKRRQLESIHLQSTTRPKANSTKQRKESKLLNNLDVLCKQLQDAIVHAGTLVNKNGEGPSSIPDSSNLNTMQDLRLLITLGSSASGPREIFALDLVQAVNDSSSSSDNTHSIPSAGRINLDQSHDSRYMDEFQAIDAQLRRDKARDMTSIIWERKLIRTMISEERLHAFFGTTISPTKMHILLSAPSHFRCPGWLARKHLDFNLDEICRLSSPGIGCESPNVGITTTGPLFDSPAQLPQTAQKQHVLFSTSQEANPDSVRSVSSMSGSWLAEDSPVRDTDTSNSSISDHNDTALEEDGLSNQSSAFKGWLPEMGSPLSTYTCSHDDQSEDQLKIDSNVDRKIMGASSSISSSTVTDDQHFCSSQLKLRLSAGPIANKVSQTHGSENNFSESRSDSRQSSLNLEIPGIRHRSKSPKPGSLLERSRLKPKNSGSGSMRSNSYRRAPPCAGITIDFSNPDQPTCISDLPLHPKTSQDRCWFQCETVLEGFR